VAVVFISPKQRQKMFFMGITIMFLLFLAFISLVVLLSKPQPVSPTLVFNKPKINLDFSILDSEQFEKLESFTKLETQFAYEAVDDKGKITSGLISAVSLDEARKFLESMKLVVTSLKEVEIGRINPFTPYFQVEPPPVVVPPTTTTRR